VRRESKVARILGGLPDVVHGVSNFSLLIRPRLETRQVGVGIDQGEGSKVRRVNVFAGLSETAGPEKSL
jgi:hypothetical protein